jgi:hypothetical protein
MEKMFSKNPARAMSFISKVPDPKTMAFGAVATGSIKAHEDAIVMGTISAKGLMFMA